MTNMRYFVTTMTDITYCNGYAIAARSKIRKPTNQVKCISITWGKMKDLNKIRKSLDSAYQKTVKWRKTISKSQEEKLEKH